MHGKKQILSREEFVPVVRSNHKYTLAFSLGLLDMYQFGLFPGIAPKHSLAVAPTHQFGKCCVLIRSTLNRFIEFQIGFNPLILTA
jgi:hypothetical protein